MNNQINNNEPMPISTSNNSSALMMWMEKNQIQGISNTDVKFIDVMDCGLGCFACRDFKVGEPIFIIPQSCILSFGDVQHSATIALVRSTIEAIGHQHLLTPEFLIWLYMCEQLAEPGSHFYPYLSSLDKCGPSISTWHHSLLESLTGTNIISSIDAVKKNLLEKMELISRINSAFRATCSPQPSKDLLPAETYNIERLTWAFSHYISRRYPGSFAKEWAYTNMDGLYTERGLGNLGSMCPLLDILNHKSGGDWLKLEAKDGALHVICNEPISEGSEIFSNYGPQSNEMFLFAYGFSVEHNEDDSVALRLMQGRSDAIGECSFTNTSNAEHLNRPRALCPTSLQYGSEVEVGTFYVKCGGVSGISEELWRALSSLSGSDVDGEEVGVTDDLHAAAAAADSADALDGYKEPSREHCDDDNDDNYVDDDDDDDDDRSGDPIEIGVEECLLLRDCLRRKLEQLAASEARAEALLLQYEAGLTARFVACKDQTQGAGACAERDYTGPQCKRVRSSSDTVASAASPTSSDPEWISSQSDELVGRDRESVTSKRRRAVAEGGKNRMTGAGARAEFIRYYRAGQRRVMEDVIHTLDEMIAGAGEEEEEEEEEEKES